MFQVGMVYHYTAYTLLVTAVWFAQLLYIAPTLASSQLYYTAVSACTQM